MKNHSFLFFRNARMAIATLALAATAVPAWSVPARQDTLTMRQPDGSELRTVLVGDENFHFRRTLDGHALIQQNGVWCYADEEFASSGIAAHEAGARSHEEENYLNSLNADKIAKSLHTMVRKGAARLRRNVISSNETTHDYHLGLFPSSSFPCTGKQKGLVVLVEYRDVKFKFADPHDYFNRLLNEPGFNDFGGTGSAADFFRENSDGRFDITFDVYGPVLLSHDREYYGAAGELGQDSRPHEMVIEACAALDPDVDFSEYDRDGDGYIDNVFVFYAGRGENAGGSTETVWPHSSNVTLLTQKEYRFDDVILDRYACSCEWNMSSKRGPRPDGVGTFVHEFSHVMGLPDLYATDYSTAFTPGSWSAMDYGPYNNDGCTPPMYSIYERNALRWTDPEILEYTGDYELPAIASNKAYLIHTQSPSEFYLIENRQHESWDRHVPGHGLLVWHVDYDGDVFEHNIVNNNASHQYVDLIEADNLKDATSRNGDSFPGVAGVTALSFDTSPSLRDWRGRSLGIALSDITEDPDTGIVRFHVDGKQNAAVDAIETGETDVKAEYYNLSGIRLRDMSSLPEGVYIERRGSETKKIIIR